MATPKTPQQLARAAKKAQKARDELISIAYTKAFNCVPVNMMDVPRIYKIGEQAHAEGRDVLAALQAVVEQFRRF